MAAGMDCTRQLLAETRTSGRIRIPWPFITALMPATNLQSLPRHHVVVVSEAEMLIVIRSHSMVDGTKAVCFH